MAAGKTTLGKLLATKLAYSFIDSDDEIERIEGKSVGEIIQQHSWDYFRQKESDWLSLVSAEISFVCAVGGGLPCHNNNLESLLYQTKSKINSDENKNMSDSDKKVLNDKIHEIEEWTLGSSSYTKDDYEVKQKELQDLFVKIAEKSGASADSQQQAPTPTTEEDNFEPKIEEID
jgi:shikimate kinase